MVLAKNLRFPPDLFILADTTGQVEGAAALIVAGDIAIAHKDNPSVAGMAGIGSRRPIIEGLRIG